MKALQGIAAGAAALVALVAAIAWFAGAFGEKIPPGEVAARVEALPPDARLHVVEAATETVARQATGTIVAKSETSVSSRILARVLSVAVRAGDTVAEGQPLVELDALDLTARVEQAREAVVAAKARLGDARATLDRTRSLHAQKAISKAELDRAEAAALAAEADANRAERAVDEANAGLAHATILSPISGRVVERFADPGDTAAPGLELLRLYNPEILRLEADVPESLAPRLRPGDRLDAFVDAAGRTVSAVVDEIVPSADPGSRSVAVKATLPPSPDLFPGMFGRIVVPTGETERILIPTEAVARVGQLAYVRVAVEREGGSVVARRFVRVGRERPETGLVEIASGLAPGEKVLLP